MNNIKYKECIEQMKQVHSSCNISQSKCDILLENLLYFCERYNSESNKTNCASVNSLGKTLNLIIKSPT